MKKLTLFFLLCGLAQSNTSFPTHLEKDPTFLIEGTSLRMVVLGESIEGKELEGDAAHGGALHWDFSLRSLGLKSIDSVFFSAEFLSLHSFPRAPPFLS